VSLAAELVCEHVLIERVAGSMSTYVTRRLANEAPAEDAARFFAFFRTYVDGYHHHREETTLFEALATALEVPTDRGPIHALTRQHHELAAHLARLEAALEPARFAVLGADERTALGVLCTKYVHGLWQHIDAENSVLLPESDARLARAGHGKLQGREAHDAELAAQDDGVRLALRYPPVHDRVAFRGDGCSACPSFGETCDGVELTWWNEDEWGDVASRSG